jgi:H+/Cl- antiporter ClcA
MLILGAQLGLSFGIICGPVFPELHFQPEGIAIVEMAAFATGVACD